MKPEAQKLIARQSNGCEHPRHLQSQLPWKAPALTGIRGLPLPVLNVSQLPDRCKPEMWR